LLAAQLQRHEIRPVRRVSGTASAIDNGLAALRDVRLAIDELDAIAGRLARETVKRGGRCDDVGAALRLRPDAARTAYCMPRNGSAGASRAERGEANGSRAAAGSSD
jgi:hypothetical protein